MMFPGRTKSSAEHPWSGKRGAVSVEDAFSVAAGAAESEVASYARASALDRSTDGATADATIGIAIGEAAAGKRCMIEVRGADLVDVQAAVTRSSGNHIPYVIRHRCRSGGGDGYQAFVAMRDSGCFLMMAGSLQECIDLGLIAHRIAEQALIPGICSEDALTGSTEVVTARVPDKGFLDEFLGRAGDTISSPTPAQQMLFGEHRRRIPRLLDLDRPAGIGARLDDSAGARARAGQEVFFLDHVEAIAREAFDEFAQLTGRSYGAVEQYRVEDADYVVVAQGAVCEALRPLVDEFRGRGRKVGLVIIRMLRPFPGVELCRMLQGKKKVTVLENVKGALAGGPPLIGEIRGCLDRAAENGQSDAASPPNPTYPRFTRSSDRPVLYSGFSSSYESVTEGDLVALIENMLPGGAGVSVFQLGVQFDATASRIPALERLSQLLDSAYAGLGKLGLRGDNSSASGTAGKSVALYASADQNIGHIAGAIARSLFELSGWSVACQSTRSGDEHRFEPAGWKVRHSMGTEDPPPATSPLHVAGIVQPYALSDNRILDSVVDEGIIVLAGSEGAAGLWDSVPARILRRVKEKRIDVRLVNAAGIAGALSEDRWVRRQLAAHAVAGAVLACHRPPIDSDVRSLCDAYGRALLEQWQVDVDLLDQCLQAFEQGLQSVGPIEVPTSGVGAAVGSPVEPRAPWTVREAPVHTETVYDAGRFWNSVGYLYETGQSEQALSDPHVATGMVPARTAAFRSWASYRTEIPSFLPENCTGCGACFTACPDAALPATVIDVPTLLESTIKEAENAGSTLLQLRRIQKHLASQAHRLVAGDARHELRYAGDLFATAFEHLAPKLGLSEEDLKPLREELDTIVEVVKSFPIARTDTFFTDPESEARGTGLLFTININADACKACGICSAICPDSALEIVPQTVERLNQYRRDWTFAAHLDNPARETIDHFVRAEKPDTLAYRLMDRRSYHSMVGGDSSFPGSGTQSTLHLIASVADTIVRPRVDGFVSELTETADALEEKIKDQLRASVDVNDFEAFGKRLSALTDRHLEPETLAGIASGDLRVDKERLQHMNDALLRVRDVIASYEGTETGTGRTGLLGVFARERSATNRGYYPYNPFSFPWINTSADSVAVAEGIFRAVTDVILTAIRSLRLARLILEDVYDPAQDDPELEGLAWDDLTDQEWSICPPVCVVAGSDREAIPYLLRVRAPVKVFLLTSDLSATDSVSDVRLWPLARPDLYVLRSTMGVRGHLLSGLIEGIQRRGPALFQLYVSEPSEHGYDPSQSVHRMRQAVDSRAFPVARYNPDAAVEWAHRWSLDGNPKPAEDWPTSTSGQVVTPAEWAFGEARFRRYFRHVPKNRWTAAMTPLMEYLTLSPADREGREPYIEVLFGDKRIVRVQAFPEVVQLVEKSLTEWRLLQEFAGIRSSVVSKVTQEADAQLQQELARLRAQLEEEFDETASKTREQFGAEFHARLTEELLNLSGFASDAETASMRLTDYLSRLAGTGPQPHPESESPSPTNGAAD